MIREQYDNRTDWLNARGNGLGASECALILGTDDAYGKLDELYNLKRGISKPKEITNARIESGVACEPLIRDLFSQAHQDKYKVDYYPFDILRNPEYPMIFATLDGELTDIENGEKGILEIKRIEVTKKAQLKEWENQIPLRYELQQVHQLIACDEMKFNLLVACLAITDWYKENGELRQRPFRRFEFRYNYIRRDEDNFKQNANYVIEKELEFWDSVQTGKRPALKVF